MNTRLDRFKKLAGENVATFESKNKDYGNSYIKTGEIMALILDGKAPVVSTAEEHACYQLITRKLDKLIRYCNLKFMDKTNNVGEKLVETMKDDGNYSLMLAELEMDNEE
jgi:hypothetical protein